MKPETMEDSILMLFDDNKLIRKEFKIMRAETRVLFADIKFLMNEINIIIKNIDNLKESQKFTSPDYQEMMIETIKKYNKVK